MRCAECIYYECAMRTPLGGCQAGEKADPGVEIITTTSTKLRTRPEKECNDLLLEERVKCLREIRRVKDRYAGFVSKVKELRDAQNAHAKTMQYGLRNEAIKLGKEVDEMLTKILGENEKM